MEKWECIILRGKELSGVKDVHVTWPSVGERGARTDLL